MAQIGERPSEKRWWLEDLHVGTASFHGGEEVFGSFFGTLNTRNTNSLRLRLHIPSSYLKNTGPGEFLIPQNMFFPESACFGVFSFQFPQKGPPKVVAVGLFFALIFFPNMTFPNRWLRRGKVEKKSTFPWHPGFFCFFHIRHQECHSSPSWDVDAGVGCWDAGWIFLPQLGENPPKTEVDQKRGPWEILKSCQSSRLRAIFGSPPTNFGIGNILLGLFSKGLLFLEKNTKVDKRGVISTSKYWCRECLRATLYSENQHHGWWLLLSEG